MESTTIPEEEEEYDDVGHASGEPIDDSIYEELPGIVEILFLTYDLWQFCLPCF